MKPINTFYRNLVKPIFFRFDPEYVHDRILWVGKLLGHTTVTRTLTRVVLSYQNPILRQEVAGLEFVNPVGLSAGFDKNAELLNILPAVGFGHAEIGSITLNPYAGNPRPRLFRLPKSKGLVVYYGLKSDGVEKLIPRFLKAKESKMQVGISVAKTNSESTSTLEGGIADYFECLSRLESAGVGDYYTINISCPNTFGGEPFTTPDRLERLLQKLSELKISKPVFVKMPINLETSDYDALLKVILKFKLTGVVIGNLTKVRDKELIKDEIPENIKGGISGLPTQKLSDDLIAYTYKNYGDQLKIIGVGGIFSAEDAYRKILNGASLLQLITGMIYEGPQVIGEINSGLVDLLKADGYQNIAEAVGAAS